MSQSNPIKLFVTHFWEENEDYFRVFEYLESDSNFYYQNFSSPDRHPPAGDKEAVREDLRRQIAPAEVLIVPAAHVERYGEIIMFQVNYAKSQEKPVVALEAYGLKVPVPKALRDVADEVIEWDKRSLIDSIRRQARHEDTTRWDTIEFKLD